MSLLWPQKLYLSVSLTLFWCRCHFIDEMRCIHWHELQSVIVSVFAGLSHDREGSLSRPVRGTVHLELVTSLSHTPTDLFESPFNLTACFWTLGGSWSNLRDAICSLTMKSHQLVFSLEIEINSLPYRGIVHHLILTIQLDVILTRWLTFHVCCSLKIKLWLNCG